jgi:hypothetical protein
VKLPGFATGGSITVGGHGGIDRNLLSLNGLPIARVSYGERINISNDNVGMNGRGWRDGNVTMFVNTPDADSFRRSQGQITRNLKRRLG